MVHINPYEDIGVLKTNMLTYVHPSYLDMSPDDMYPNVLSWNERHVGGQHSDFFVILGIAVWINGKNTYAGFRIEVEDLSQKEKAMSNIYRPFYSWSSSQSDDVNTWSVPHIDYD